MVFELGLEFFELEVTVFELGLEFFELEVTVFELEVTVFELGLEVFELDLEFFELLHKPNLVIYWIFLDFQSIIQKQKQILNLKKIFPLVCRACQDESIDI